MKYTILFYETPAETAKREDPEQQGPYWGAWNAYFQAIDAAGVPYTGSALLPAPTATTVRLSGGQRHVQDGPYADTKEQLGGFIILDVADLDAALDWAERSPAASNGAVEVRPVLPMSS